MSIIGPFPTFFKDIETAPEIGDRGIFAGGRNINGSVNNVIDYIAITTAGNAVDFGDILTPNGQLGYGGSNSINNRGCYNSGYTSTTVDTIEYITINSPGNASDFGNLTVACYSNTAASNATNQRLLFIGGDNTRGVTVDYITINSAGNATDFGDLTKNYPYLAATSNASNERAIVSGVDDNTIQYLTINSTGNASDFGDVLVSSYRRNLALSNGTNERGLFCGGYNSTVNDRDMIQYVTINSAGNAIDFGNMRGERLYGSALSNLTGERGICGSFCKSNNIADIIIDIEYVTVNSPGNATDFGDLTSTRTRASGFSNG